jgi:hypothetical protein
MKSLQKTCKFPVKIGNQEMSDELINRLLKKVLVFP